MKKALFVVCLLFTCFLTQATQFEALPNFDINAKYKKGDVVKFNHYIYIHHPKADWHKLISKRQNKEDINPTELISSFGKRIQLTNIKPWQKLNHYKLGDSVIYKQHYYTLVKNTNKHNKKWKTEFWFKFDHPALGFSIPDYDPRSQELNTLLGVDSNLNNIRDDFELKIIMSSLPNKTKKHALKSGLIYTRLMEYSETNNKQRSFTGFISTNFKPSM
ncbi:hypothetical protein [Catenovulum maritimum]|uniref:DUF2490 domain-containing protein n=1 Tax=Catenovulum maritimum TaxID=1513271 RepID=A0A0J8GSS5_9ALTE|nr:hypothetical protein [Catenovulum maritimum]KMT65802.1 hypothetical protein XM47_07325 [Catenovulum maritimum]